MALREYKKKRDFKKTPEPEARVAAPRGKSLFVIQKHDASRLHYDLRLELGGVLKSWAVPRGPSLDPAVRSLAVEVEDHPVAYATFEGIIPAGEYGGGTVLVWDHGTWETEEPDPERSLRKGHMRFTLHGEKLEGGWSLVRTHSEGDKNNWLLIKRSDENAVPGDGHGVTDREEKSVLTHRPIEEVAADGDRIWTREGEKKGAKKGATALAMKAAAQRTIERVAKQKSEVSQTSGKKGKSPLVELTDIEGALRGPMPKKLPPQLAKLVDTVPTGDNWLHELKFDGYRILAEIEDGKVRLLTRKGNDWTKKFRPTAEQLKKLPFESAVLDGELVALNERGVSSFQRLQAAISKGATEDLTYYVFDAVYLNGFDLRSVPLLERKQAVATLILGNAPENEGPIRYSDHIQGQGGEVLTHSCKSALEGIVCKRADSRYESRRSDSWVKVKCHGRQEMVICGFTEPEGSRRGFGSLLLGYFDDGKLFYAGRVGTGFDQKLLKGLRKRLDELVIDRSPFAKPLASAERRGATFVTPELVCEIEFTEWTGDGHLRHPSFQGLREDKPARDVRRERPAREVIEKESEMQSPKSEPVAKKPHKSSTAATKARGRKVPKRRSALTAATEDNIVASVQLTHPERVLFPDVGVTKLDLARYYADVAEWILPHVVERPLSLVRCPDGSTGQCFYQKHWKEMLPKAIGFMPIKEKSGSDKYVKISDLAGLVSLTQISVLEVHPWGAKADKVESPDRIVIDLDPGPEVEWDSVIQGALDVRSVIEELGLESFVRTSGGKGLHVVIPLARRNTWDEVETFAHQIAAGLSLHASHHYVANMRKALRKGRIYVDYLRNQRGSTAVASYSTRSRPGCPVAMPLSWNELKRVKAADAFTLQNTRARLAKLKRDPWERFFSVKQSLSKEMLERACEFSSASAS